LKNAKHVAVWILTVMAPAVLFADCSSIPENVVPACGFENDSDILAWTEINGSVSLSTTVMHGGMGSGHLVPTDYGTFHRVYIRSECFAYDTTAQFGYGAFFLLNTGLVDGFCVAGSNLYSNPDCTGTSTMVGGPPQQPTISEWMLSTSSWQSLPGYLSAALYIACDSDVAFTVFVDDSFFGTGLVPVELSSFTIE